MSSMTSRGFKIYLCLVSGDTQILITKNMIFVYLYLQTGLEPLPLKATGFQLLSFDNLMDVAEPITPLDPMYWQQFNSKDQGPVGQR